MTEGRATLSEDEVRAAARVLSQHFHTRVRITGHESLSHRQTVFRAHLEGRGAPATAVIKTPRLADGKAYDPNDLSPRSPAWLLSNEWAALELLDLRAADTGTVDAPGTYGGDFERGILVIEDLGDGPSLADALLGGDATIAETAMLAFARSLGRMHATTVGRHSEFDAMVGRFTSTRLHTTAPRADVRAQIARIPEVFDELEFEWSPALIDDVQQVVMALLNPEPFHTLTHGDPCPDNDRLIDGRAIFFDFEHAGFRNALLDGAYGRVPFPTCWCVNRLPEWLITKFENAYRLELMRGVPEVEDDDIFEPAIMKAAGWWLLQNAVSLLPQALRFDERWGISTLRQRLLYRFEVFARNSGRAGCLEAMGAWAYQMGQKMRAKWPEVQEMPVFAAFRTVDP
jgi:hypothetical protein